LHQSQLNSSVKKPAVILIVKATYEKYAADSGQIATEMKYSDKASIYFNVAAKKLDWQNTTNIHLKK